jgi:hypothetical protein
VTTLGESLFHSCKGLTSITIPSSVTSIGGVAFGYCSSLTSITIPSSVTSIEHGAFWGCSALTSITIPSSVTSIGDGAFNYCTGLNKYTVDTGNPNYSTTDDVLFSKDMTTLVAYPNKKSSQYVIPPSVTSIKHGAFYGCTGLTSIIIPSSVTSIGESAFQDCSSLTSITIPSSVTSIGRYAFSHRNSGLSEIHCQLKVPVPVRIYSFTEAENKTVKLYVPKGSKAMYAKAKEWREFATILEE